MALPCAAWGRSWRTNSSPAGPRPVLSALCGVLVDCYTCSRRSQVFPELISLTWQLELMGPRLKKALL